MRLRRLRSLFVSFVCFVVPLCHSHGADAEFVHVWTGWRNDATFERIAEYFGGGESHGRQTVLRTRTEVRDGYYFLVRVKHAAPLANAKFVLHVIRPGAPESAPFTFSIAEARTGESVFQLGLTGPDWPGGKNASPVAWKIELLAADGRMLGEQKSFLWEKPAK